MPPFKLRAIFLAVNCALSLASSAATVNGPLADKDGNERLRALRSLTDEDTALQQNDTADIVFHNHDLPEGWPVPGPESFETTLKLLKKEAAEQQNGNRADFPNIIQPISFINFVKTDGTGRNSYATIQKQVDQLNNAFSGKEAQDAKYANWRDTNIRFKLAGVRYIVDDNYYDLCALPTEIAKYRPKYMMSGAIHLNIYICWCQYNLGLSWLPYDSWRGQNTDENHFALGAIIHSDLLPGNNMKDGLWSKGNILTHEVGHSYGLRHPYENDCMGTEDISDQIADTPRMTGNPLVQCSKVKNRDSCPKLPGKDDMSNYMVATADSCRNHFTPGQVDYMQMVIRNYKKTLMKQLLPSCVAAIDSTDNSPDLQPCLDGTVKLSTDGRRFCKTDPDDADVWAWACCPESLNWDQQECWQGTPEFDKPRNGPTAPRASGVAVTAAPTQKPNDAGAVLTRAPTRAPTDKPTTKAPTKKPTKSPTKTPTKAPTKKPTKSPTSKPTKAPTKKPTNKPTKAPTTMKPTVRTNTPTKKPTKSPTKFPTKAKKKKNKKKNKKKPTKYPTKMSG